MPISLAIYARHFLEFYLTSTSLFLSSLHNFERILDSSCTKTSIGNFNMILVTTRDSDIRLLSLYSLEFFSDLFSNMSIVFKGNRTLTLRNRIIEFYYPLFLSAYSAWISFLSRDKYPMLISSSSSISLLIPLKAILLRTSAYDSESSESSSLILLVVDFFSNILLCSWSKPCSLTILVTLYVTLGRLILSTIWPITLMSRMFFLMCI